MKALVAYYSRGGTTKKVAEKISALLEADIEEIHDLKKRSGIIGWLKSARDASSRKLTTLEAVKNDASTYDIIVIGPTHMGRHPVSASQNLHLTT